MLFYKLRRIFLVGAALAALSITGIAAADHDSVTDHGYIQKHEPLQASDGGQKSQFTLLSFSGVSPEECRFFEMNIPGYQCDLTLAQWAAVEDSPTYPPPPEGVDYLYWEQNVWEMGGSNSSYAWVASPVGMVVEADDVSFPLADFAAP